MRSRSSRRVAAYALVQRSDARTQTRHARGGSSPARRRQTSRPTRSSASRLALRAAMLAPGRETADVLRASLGAMRETAALRLGGNIRTAAFAPRGERLLVAAAATDGSGSTTGRGGRLRCCRASTALTQAAWSPDGRLFATGEFGGDVSVWRLGTDRPVRTIHTPSPVNALSFDRTTLLVASGTHVRLVDLATGRVKTIGFQGAVVTAVLDPKGRVFAVATRSGKSTTASILDADTGRVVAHLREARGGIRSFAFSPDGRLLASGSYDRTARIWEAHTGRLVHVLRHHGYVLAEQFSPDGRLLVTSSQDGAAYVWDVSSGQRELLLVGSAGATNEAAFSPDGSEIATASADRLGRIYYSQDGRLLAPLAGHRSAVTNVGFDPSGTKVVTGSTDGSARIWDALPQGALVPISRNRQPVDALFVGADPVSVSGRRAQILSTSGEVLSSVTMRAPIVAAAANDHLVAVADAHGNVKTFEPSGRHTSFSNGSRITALAFASRRTLLEGAADGRVYRERASTRRPYVDAGGRVLGISAARGRFLVRLADSLRVYADDGNPLSTIRTQALHATLSPDGSTIATTKGNAVRLWNASTGKLLYTLTRDRSPVNDAEFSPNGHELVTVGDDHKGRIWSVASGRLLYDLVGHNFPVYSGSYSSDGHWIVTGSQFTAGLWNAATGQLVFLLGRDAKRLTGASFSPAGNWILTGSEDGTARVYHCAICEPLSGLEATARARIRALR